MKKGILTTTLLYLGLTLSAQVHDFDEEGVLWKHATNNNIGIGTQPPAANLDVFGAGASKFKLSTNNPGYNLILESNVDANNRWNLKADGFKCLGCDTTRPI